MKTKILTFINYNGRKTLTVELSVMEWRATITSKDGYHYTRRPPRFCVTVWILDDNLRKRTVEVRNAKLKIDTVYLVSGTVPTVKDADQLLDELGKCKDWDGHDFVEFKLWE